MSIDEFLHSREPYTFFAQEVRSPASLKSLAEFGLLERTAEHMQWANGKTYYYRLKG